MNEAFKLKRWAVIVLLILTITPLLYAEEQESLSRQGFAPDASFMDHEQSLIAKTQAVTATLPGYAGKAVSSYRGYTREKCITCHEGIEEVSASHPKEFGCTVCHGGDGNSAEKKQAHSTLIYDPDSSSGRGNPSALSTVKKSCGQAHCHSGHEQEDRNHIERVRKSIMAAMTGVISSLRFQWGGQTGKDSKYGAYEVTDKDGSIPRHWGAIPNLEALPFFSPSGFQRARQSKTNLATEKISGHVGDGVLRDKCFVCHLENASAERSQGCAACHFTRAKDGLYKGGDPVVNKKEPGHPAYHRIAALPEKSGCLQCHKNFSMADDTEQKHLSAKQSASGGFFLPGKGRAKEDVHFKAGLECIDCHTQFDIMGDGNIYSRQFQAVEIRCETCHGHVKAGPSVAQITHPDDRAVRLSRHYKGFVNKTGDWMAVSARGRKMTNVKAIGKKITTLEKRSGKKHTTPLVRNGSRAHFLSGHSRLGCTACHSQWSKACADCAIVYNQSKGPETDTHKSLPDRVVEPVLIMGPRGKIVAMLPRHNRKFTALDEKDHLVEAIDMDGDSLGPYRDWEFTNPMGYSGGNAGFASQPHSVGKQARSCVSCHLSSTALGLGEGEMKIGKVSTGKMDRMEPLIRTNIVSRISELSPKASVTLRGEKVAGSGQPGVRPLNQKEITRVLKVGNCIPCHGSYSDPIYKDIEKSYKFEKSVGHRKLRKKILR